MLWRGIFCLTAPFASLDSISAWGDNAPGAICSITIAKDGAVSFKRPRNILFNEALAFINAERSTCDTCIVAIDQPTIVPNRTGGRLVDKIAGSVIGFIGGGVQMASRSKTSLFGEGAPIWRFLASLRATQDPELCRTALGDLFIIEVFPALALPAFNVQFYGRRQAPKYNPDNKKFRRNDWLKVIETVARYACAVPIEGIEAWARETTKIEKPCKADQDQLDAVLCALICYHWRAAPRQESIMIGSLTCGYMISPTSAAISERLKTKAAQLGVCVDGTVPIVV